MKFSLSQLKKDKMKCLTTDGKKVRILCTNRKNSGNLCLVGLVTIDSGWGKVEAVCQWYKDGRGLGINDDLVNLKRRKK